MNRFIAPLALGFMMSVAGNSAAQSQEIEIERYGWMMRDGGCHVRARADGEKISLDDLRNLHENGETRDGRVTLQTLFPGESEDMAKQRVEEAAKELIKTMRAIKNDPACKF